MRGKVLQTIEKLPGETQCLLRARSPRLPRPPPQEHSELDLLCGEHPHRCQGGAAKQNASVAPELGQALIAIPLTAP